MKIAIKCFLVYFVIFITTMIFLKENNVDYKDLDTVTECVYKESKIRTNNVNMVVPRMINFSFASFLLFAISHIVFFESFCNSSFEKVLHESLKNIKQYARGSIDNRTCVRYNKNIATLVRAVNGGSLYGRKAKR